MNVDNLPKVPPSQFKELLALFWKTKTVPLYIHGKSGVGKTSMIGQYAETINATCINFKILYKEPSDIQGFPYLDHETKRTVWFAPSYYPPSDSLDNFIFFFDETSSAESHMQNAILEPVLERRAGDYKFPVNTLFVLAGNLPDEGCFVNEISAALLKRCAHVVLTSNVNDTVEHFINIQVIPEITSFLASQPAYLDGNPSHGSEGKSENSLEPCPRSWEQLSDLYKTNNVNLNDVTSFASLLAQSKLGAAAGAEFIVHVSEFGNMPSIDEIQKLTKEFYVKGTSTKFNKMLGKIDTDSRAYCVLYNLESYAQGLSENEPDKIIEFLEVTGVFFLQLMKANKIQISKELLNLYWNQVANKVCEVKKINKLKLHMALAKTEIGKEIVGINKAIQPILEECKAA